MNVASPKSGDQPIVVQPIVQPTVVQPTVVQPTVVQPIVQQTSKLSAFLQNTLFEKIGNIKNIALKVLAYIGYFIASLTLIFPLVDVMVAFNPITGFRPKNLI